MVRYVTANALQGFQLRVTVCMWWVRHWEEEKKMGQKW